MPLGLYILLSKSSKIECYKHYSLSQAIKIDIEPLLMYGIIFRKDVKVIINKKFILENPGI